MPPSGRKPINAAKSGAETPKNAAKPSPRAAPNLDVKGAAKQGSGGGKDPGTPPANAGKGKDKDKGAKEADKGKDKAAKAAAATTKGQKKAADEKPTGGTSGSSAAAGAGASADPPKQAVKKVPTDGFNQKKIEHLTEELMYATQHAALALQLALQLTLCPPTYCQPARMLPHHGDTTWLTITAPCRATTLAVRRRNRKPLDPKLRDGLIAKCGPPVQEVHFVRNEAKPPMGRPDELAPSRHERIPPACVVLMFNCFECSFDLGHGDLKTLPESDTTELRSLTSGKVIGRVKIAPEKGTAFEERVMFNNDWYVGSEHGLNHDGLQSDGFIELRLDWRDSYGDPHVAIIRANPWLAYGCGEGARLAVRKPGATEGTAATVQRALRDDHVVVRRDGTDGELTVDPTPFAVVAGTNPRHPAGTRLLLVYENSCVDAVVEPWPEVRTRLGRPRHVRMRARARGAV